MKKKIKFTKDMIKNIVIVVLSIIVLVLSCVLIFGNKVVKYKYFNNELLTVDNNSSFEVTADVVDYRSVVVVLSSDVKKNLTGVVKVKAYDDSGKKLAEEETRHVILSGCKAVSIVNLPDLEDKNAGKIEVTVTENEDTYDNQFDVSKIYSKTDYKVDENKIVHVNLQLTNNASQKIQNLFGYIVAYKGDKIVAVNSFTGNNIEAGGSFNTSTDLSATSISNTVKALDFDKLETIITFAE